MKANQKFIREVENYNKGAGAGEMAAAPTAASSGTKGAGAASRPPTLQKLNVQGMTPYLPRPMKGSCFVVMDSENRR
eukprot:7010965-Prorocentrum_lima.AAC.1